MTSYCTVDDVKTYLEITTSDKDTLIGDLIISASREIDVFCQRKFYLTEETRKFDALEDVYKNTLFLDDDLVSVTTITNGDNTEITSSEYLLEPANEEVKWGISIKSNASISWTWENESKQAISVTGSFGFIQNGSTPNDIRFATYRLVAWRFKQRLAPFESVQFEDTGIQTIPTAMPVDIKRIIEPYKRLEIFSINTKGNNGFS